MYQFHFRVIILHTARRQINAKKKTESTNVSLITNSAYDHQAFVSTFMLQNITHAEERKHTRLAFSKF